MERVIDGTGKNTVWQTCGARQSFETVLVVFQHSDYHTVLYTDKVCKTCKYYLSSEWNMQNKILGKFCGKLKKIIETHNLIWNYS